MTPAALLGAMAYATRHFSVDDAGFIAGRWYLVVGLAIPGVGILFDSHRYKEADLLDEAMAALGK
jgi:hypothetical protein